MRRSRTSLILAVILGLAPIVSAQDAQFDWQRFKGTELRVLLNTYRWLSPPWQQAIVPHLKDFEARTGIKVSATPIPGDVTRAGSEREPSPGMSGADVVVLAPAREGLKYVRAGWLQPVDAFLKDASLTAPDYGWNDFLDRTREAMTVEGTLLGPPVQVENVALMYRKDLFQRYNVKVPSTLDELEAAAKALHGKPMIDEGQPGVGFVGRGRRAAATSVFAGMLHAMGATWLGPNREPAFNTEEGIQAFEMWGRLLRLYGPPRSENNTWYEASAIFSQGKAAMYIDANSLFPVIENLQHSRVAGKIGYTLFPRGPKGHSGSTVAVWGLAVPKASKNQQAAWLFVQWATNKEQVLKVQSEWGVLGCRESVWKDVRGKGKVPGDLAESLIQASKAGTPFWNPPVVAVDQVREAIGAAIVTSIQGGDVRLAVRQAAADVKRILAETEKK
jgi:multiple sugar transport system substrate-binding protein